MESRLAVSGVAVAVESVSEGVAGQGVNGGIAVVAVVAATHHSLIAIVIQVAVFDQERRRSEGAGIVSIVWGDFTSPQLVVGEDGVGNAVALVGCGLRFGVVDAVHIPGEAVFDCVVVGVCGCHVDYTSEIRIASPVAETADLSAGPLPLSFGFFVGVANPDLTDERQITHEVEQLVVVTATPHADQ